MKSLFLLCVTIFLFSCNRSNGKIESRSDVDYLINLSFNQKIRFTIKETIIENNKNYFYRTELIELEPGEERLLTPEADTILMDYPEIVKYEKRIYKPLNEEQKRIEDKRCKEEQKRNRFILCRDDFEKMGQLAVEIDTVINGERMVYVNEEIRYRDTSIPIPTYKRIYEVVGEVPIKSK